MEGELERQVEVVGTLATQHGNIRAADACVSNLHRGAEGGGEEVLSGGASEGNIADINEGGYYSILGQKQGFLKALSWRVTQVTHQALFGEY
jgi:hypothetical protein